MRDDIDRYQREDCHARGRRRPDQDAPVATDHREDGSRASFLRVLRRATPTDPVLSARRPDVARRNLDATRALLHDATVRPGAEPGDGAVSSADVPVSLVKRFLGELRSVHADSPDLDPTL